MRKTTRSTHVLLALMTALSLSFGAASAFAAANEDPTIIGTCSSQADCQSKCELAGGFAGECDIKGRCHCAY
jgi:hypothetical protein